MVKGELVVLAGNVTTLTGFVRERSGSIGSAVIAPLGIFVCFFVCEEFYRGGKNGEHCSVLEYGLWWNVCRFVGIGGESKGFRGDFLLVSTILQQH